MVPASTLMAPRRTRFALAGTSLRARRHRARHAARSIRHHVAWVLIVAAVATPTALWLSGTADLSDRVRDLRTRLAGAQAELASSREREVARDLQASELRSRVARLTTKVDSLEEARVRTVVVTETTVKKVERWVPDGEGVSVELTGFESEIGVHDVQLTHAYGYSDVIGIAVNQSGRTIAYAQLGCTFLDAQGRVLLNEITNKQSWPAGATWGFVCSGQADATGVILRVDEIS